MAVRIDKWLWAARFFKTRALAAKACDLNRVQWNGQSAKPAREVKVGDTLRVETPGSIFTIEILELSENRGPAPVAQALYRETDESKRLRAEATEIRKLLPVWEQPSASKPNKRDRRLIHRFRND